MPGRQTTNSSEFIRPIICVSGKFPIDHKQLDTEQNQTTFKRAEKVQSVDEQALLDLIAEQEREDELKSEVQQ